MCVSVMHILCAFCVFTRTYLQMLLTAHNRAHKQTLDTKCQIYKYTYNIISKYIALRGILNVHANIIHIYTYTYMRKYKQNIQSIHTNIHVDLQLKQTMQQHYINTLIQCIYIYIFSMWIYICSMRCI